MPTAWLALARTGAGRAHAGLCHASRLIVLYLADVDVAGAAADDQARSAAQSTEASRGARVITRHQSRRRRRERQTILVEIFGSLPYPLTSLQPQTENSSSMNLILLFYRFISMNSDDVCEF